MIQVTYFKANTRQSGFSKWLLSIIILSFADGQRARVVAVFTMVTACYVPDRILAL